MKMLTVSEAKRLLDDVLDQALAGETIVIMRHDQPVLLQPCQVPVLTPARPPEPERTRLAEFLSA